jgi:phosphoglucosamine mutase
MRAKPELFGTDGVRGVAGEYPLDRATIFRLGRAVGSVLARHAAGKSPRLLLGRDTRESSGWIAGTLAAGLETAGARVTAVGVFTTPGIAFLTRQHGFDAGVAVSASHNPYHDNGIKVLAGAGTKLSESREIEIERELAELATEEAETAPAPFPRQGEHPAAPPPAPKTVGRLEEEYVAWLCGLLPDRAALKRLRIVVDCANGAASRAVPKVLERLGLEARILHAAPDGRNINRACGSLHPSEMARATAADDADLGVAFDGDADRAIFAVRDGRVLDGDYVLYAAALDRQRRGALRNHTVVGTLMTNLGLELALARHGIVLRRAAVGDKFVLEEMLRAGAELGGEPSGHIIFADHSLAGDGILTTIEMLRLVIESGKPFAELVAGLRVFPQTIRNVRVLEKPPLDTLPEVGRAIEACRRAAGARGRVVVRYSGTEPLARVMVEAEDADLVERHTRRIAEAIESALGAKPAGSRAR